MRNFNEQTITDAVIAQVSRSANPRVKQISESLVRHLHAFVREVQLTEPEWSLAIEFLTRTGKTCNANRQEFILLSDTLGVSMLVDAINHHSTGGATENTVLGPFYVQDPPEYPLGADIHRNLSGEPLYVQGRVIGPDGQLVVGAVVDVWHSDQDGYYDVQHLQQTGGWAGRGRFRTDGEGGFRFWTIKPAAYPIPHDSTVGEMLSAQDRHPWRPAHIHFMIDAPNCDRLTTHLFVNDDPYLDSDAVFGVKDSLIADYVPHQPGVAPDGRELPVRYYTLNYDFKLRPSMISTRQDR